ncbi:MAG: WhiB family transcriptional regulator [Acidimicrobiia bacterium]|nr:WhiB family transcriptional regulator [Acidimicrobiia bacterium]
MSLTLEADQRDARDHPDPGPHWRVHAACRSCSPDLFFPAGTTGAAADEIAAAKVVCAQCPVQSQCLRFAMATGQAYGIWGGTTEAERVILRRLGRGRTTALPA